MAALLDWLLRFGGLSLCVLSFWGWGVLLTRWLEASATDRVLLQALRVTAGLVACMVVLQALGAAGGLVAVAMWATLGIGWLAALHELRTVWSCFRFLPIGNRPVLSWNGLAAVLVMAAILATTAKSTLPVYLGDGVMYHLPHAALWARAGQLTINEHIRYPWFPYNYDLLYAAAIVLWDDVMSHLLHGLAGWLTAVLIWRVTREQFGEWAGVAGALLWLWLSRWFYDSAYTELGSSLLLTACFVAMWLWQSEKRLGWLLLAWFFLGAAAGTKYQALVYAPFVAGLTLWRCREPRPLLAAALAFLIPCIYWYARNWLHTGNPFNPLAGSVFGWFDWDAGDMAIQVMDLKYNARNWPPRVLGLSALALVMPAFWRNGRLRTAMLLGIWAFGVWYFTSHYDRYLFPVYPVYLLLLCGAVHMLLAGALRPVSSHFSEVAHWRWVQWLPLACALVIGSYSVWNLARRLQHLPVTHEQKQAFIRDKVFFAGLLQKLHPYAPAKAYQIGMEGAIYLSPLTLYGDHFGRWRYRDYMPSPHPDGHSAAGTQHVETPKQLAAKLRAQGMTYLLLRNDQIQRLETMDGFRDCFKPIEEDKGNRAYTVCDE